MRKALSRGKECLSNLHGMNLFRDWDIPGQVGFIPCKPLCTCILAGFFEIGYKQIVNIDPARGKAEMADIALWNSKANDMAIDALN